MQKYTEIASSQTLRASRELLLNNDKTALSCSSGTSFPTENIYVGMLCYRTDTKKLYQLTGENTWTLFVDFSSGHAVVYGANNDATGNKYVTTDEAQELIKKAMEVDGMTLKPVHILTSGTYTVPEGVTKIYVSGCAGGASGGLAGGGGGGQSIMRKELTVTAGQKIAVTIGTGGKGYWNMPSSGTGSYGWQDIPCNAGGDTQFGSFFTLKGGKSTSYSGQTFTGFEPSLAGGEGATNGERYHQIIEAAYAGSNAIVDGGRGGDSLFGSGGSGGMCVMAGEDNLHHAVPATSGIGYGSGGGGLGWYVGSGSSRGYTNGGDGANGVIIVEYE